MVRVSISGRYAYLMSDESKLDSPPEELFRTERAFSKIILLGDVQVE